MSGDRPVGAGVVVACGFVELMSWGSLYYSVPVLQDRITADEGWSTVSVTATYSAALVVSALLSPRVGRYVDAHGPRALVSAGVLLGATGLVVVALAPTLGVLAAGMLIVGVGQAATLYPPVFAALTIWFGERSARGRTVGGPTRRGRARRRRGPRRAHAGHRHGCLRPLGSRGFGALSSHFTRPVALAIAAAPFLSSALAVATGTHARAALVLAALTALALLAARRT